MNKPQSLGYRRIGSLTPIVPPIIGGTANLREPTNVILPTSPQSKENIKRALERLRLQFLDAWASMPNGTEVFDEPSDQKGTTIFADLMYSKHTAKCEINVMEYSMLQVWSSRTLTNREFIEYINLRAADPTRARLDAGPRKEGQHQPKTPGISSVTDDLAKVKVTWIEVKGIDWNVIKKLQKTFSIHPLVVEEIMEAYNSEKESHCSKLDYFDEHLFVRIARHIPTEDNTTIPSYMENIRSKMPAFQSASGDLPSLGGRKPDESKQDKETQHTTAPNKGSNQYNWETDQHIEELPFRTAPFFILMNKTRDTVITITTIKDGFTEPIGMRMRTKHFSILRKTSDPSLLVHSLLDLITAEAGHVLEDFQKRVRELEREVIRWKMSSMSRETIQKMHILARDLTTALRSLRPIHNMIEGIRRFDVERFSAMQESNQAQRPPVESNRALIPSERGHASAEQSRATTRSGAFPDIPAAKPQGYFTPYVRVYMADLLYRTQDIIDNVEKFHDITENLSNHAFNAKAYEINEIMRILTFVNVICLPLAISTAYFGMNFINMSATRHTESFFWAISVPVVSLTTIFLFYNDVKRQLARLDELYRGRYNSRIPFMGGLRGTSRRKSLGTRAGSKVQRNRDWSGQQDEGASLIHNGTAV